MGYYRLHFKDSNLLGSINSGVADEITETNYLKVTDLTANRLSSHDFLYPGLGETNKTDAKSLFNESKIRIVNFGRNAERPERNFMSNRIHTSKYTFWNFLPKNLYYQFRKLANLYFLVMGFFQMIPKISITGGQPTMAMPMSFVIFVSMLKDIIEDYKR